jgi:hypothetical protein
VLKGAALASFVEALEYVKTPRYVFGIALTIVAIAYLGGYLFVVQPQVHNPFLSWKGVPLPKDAFYRVDSAVMRWLYEPLTRLDRSLLPKRWLFEPPLQYQQDLTNIDVEWVFGDAKKREAAQTRTNEATR